MVRQIILLLLCGTYFSLAAQQGNSETKDLEYLYAVLKKTPSFKYQIKGAKREAYQQLYQEIKNEIEHTSSQFERFIQLSRLLLPIKDNHLFFYQAPVTSIKFTMLSDSTFIRQYRTSEAFRSFPRVTLNLDSLTAILTAKDSNSIEGLYFNNYLKVGVYRTQKADSLVGVVLQTKLPHWDEGQIAFILNEYEPNRFRAFHANILQRTFALYKNEKFRNHMLTESGWRKFPNETDYINIGNTPLFDLKSLYNDMQYLRLGSFATTTKSLAVSENFFNKIKDSLYAKYLIVDIRNNGGGGFKASKKFLKLLKQYSRHGKVYMLINNGTFSNAEQFTLGLAKLKNVMTLGERTNGTLTYGNNYGRTETLPSSKYKLYITDMRDDGHYLSYEEIGVEPDVYLHADTNWVTQTIAIICEESNSVLKR